LIKSYLKRRLPSLTAATLCTLLLGLVSALTFAMVGPAVQILSDPQRTAPVSLVELFGQRLGEVFSQLLGRSSFSMSELWQELPQWVLGAAALRAALAMSQWFLWERSSELIAREMRQNLVDSYLGLEPEARRDRAGLIDREIAAGVSNDIRMVREYLVHFLGGFPRELVQVLFYLVTLFMLEPMLASLFLVGLGPAAALLSRLSKKLRKRSQAVLDNSSDLVEWLQQRVSGAETIKQYRTEQLEIERLNRSSGG
jgi:ABC-type multidrug transport system fused ATPase/permease subunit